MSRSGTSLFQKIHWRYHSGESRFQILVVQKVHLLLVLHVPQHLRQLFLQLSYWANLKWLRQGRSLEMQKTLVKYQLCHH